MNLTMTEHTPGPWKVGQGDFSGCIFAVDREQGRLREGTPYPIASVIHRDAEGARNAQLIAAAPVLLNALEQALQWIEVDETTHGREFSAGNVARAAIAKATKVEPNA